MLRDAAIYCGGHGRAGAPLPGGPPSDGPPRRAALGGGLPGAVDAGREPDQSGTSPTRPGFSRRSCSDGAPLEPSFDYLFNSYYEAVGPRHPRAARGLLSRPSLDEVRRYRRRIDERVLEALERGMRDEVRARVVLGLEHEQQHQELILTDIKHLLGGQPGAPAYRRAPAAPARSAGLPPPEKQQSQTAPPARSDWRLPRGARVCRRLKKQQSQTAPPARSDCPLRRQKRGARPRSTGSRGPGA